MPSTTSIPSLNLSTRPKVHGFTIDSATSRDLDDAFFVERTLHGYRLTISIADVAAYVERGSVLDDQAKQMVETRYYRNGNHPMLPVRYSEGCLSLLPYKPRPVLTVTVDLAEDCTIAATEIIESQLTSQARFSQEETDLLLLGPPNPLRDQMDLCRKVASRLQAHRQERGACAFYDLRQGLYADEEGVIRRSASVHAQIIVQEFMILANETVATTLARTGRAFLYRNHQARSAAPGRDEILRQLQDALLNPQSLPALLTRTQLWMDRATYDPILLGHFGLNLPAYGHFTSPIRRYADLINHRIVKAAIKGEPEPYAVKDLAKIAKDINTWKEAQAEATQEHFREKAVQERRRAVVAPAAALDAMDAPAFGQALEQAVKDDTPTEDLLNALGLRILRQGVVPADLHHLFFRGGAGWDQARRQALKVFEEEPYLAVSTLDILRSKDQAVLEYEVGAAGPERFKAAVMVTYTGRRLAAVAFDSSKKTARALAAVAWLRGRLEGTLLTPDRVPGLLDPGQSPNVTPSPTLTPPSLAGAGDNPIGSLHEWCQQHRIASPTFTYKGEGPAHLPCFRSTAALKLDQEELEIEGPTSTSKQEAKRLAAQALLAHLHGRLSS